MPTRHTSSANSLWQDVRHRRALEDVILRTPPHCLERDILIAQAAEHDDGNSGQSGARADEALNPAGFRKTEVQHQQIHGLCLRVCGGVAETANREDLERSPLGRAQRLPDQQHVTGVVLDQQDSNGGGRLRAIYAA